jgi:hypothetical protein
LTSNDVIFRIQAAEATGERSDVEASLAKLGDKVLVLLLFAYYACEGRVATSQSDVSDDKGYLCLLCWRYWHW